MFLIYGKRTANIKSITDYQEACTDCKSFGLDITISQEYFHLYYIPFAPVGSKVVYMRCCHCGNPNRSFELEKNYAAKTRSPFYYYSIPLLIVTGILFIVFANQMSRRQTAERVAHPQTGDVYRLRDDNSQPAQYYFLKVVAVTPTAVLTHHGSKIYSGFVSDPLPGDYFVPADTIRYTIPELVKMQQEGMISSVNRATD